MSDDVNIVRPERPHSTGTGPTAIERALASIDKAQNLAREVAAQLSERDVQLVSAETASVNPVTTSVRDIMARIERDQGHGLKPSEIIKLYKHVTLLESILVKRPVGWTISEREYLVESGVLR